MPATTRDNRPAEADAQRLYLDFDSFFATAEQYFNPDLRGKPLGVVPLDTLHTGCIAVSREAKALGVPGGATITAARAIAPHMIFVVARPDAYVRLHHRILETIEKCLPVAQVRSIDELVCELLPSEAADPAQIARRIKSALAITFDPMLTCSIGIAKTEMLAKIGAEMNKPDGFTYLRMADLPGSLAKLRLKDLPGVSTGIETRLAAGGIRDVTALWNIGAKHARALWGNVEGERFWNALHGRHVERPETKKRMFGHSRMLPMDWRTPEKVGDCARQLTMGAGRRLRRADIQATKLSLSVRGGGYRSERSGKKDDKRWNCEIAFLPARDDQSLLRTLAEGLLRYRREVQFAPRSVSVMLHGLVKNDQLQGDLFGSSAAADTDEDWKASKAKRERLSEVMDQLRTAHGPAAASFGPVEEIPGGYLGAKIAFGRIPDLADFSEAPTQDGATHFCS